MTADEILESLDRSARVSAFPMLDNGYIFPVDVRMNVYRDDFTWLIIIENISVSNQRTAGLDSFQNALHLFGTDLDPEDTHGSIEIFSPIEECADALLFDSQHDWFLRSDAKELIIQGTRVKLDLSSPNLKKRGIEFYHPPEIDPVTVMRSLVPEYRSLLLASDEELEACNPRRLPLFLRADEWHHPDLANGQLPSETETFQMLAEAIATGDKARYLPTEPPNTHWSNWPEGGML